MTKLNHSFVLIGIFFCGALGAFLRTEIFDWTHQLGIGLIIVNTAGSFILGLVSNSRFFSKTISTVVSQGLCGALTTMSGFSAYVHDLYQKEDALILISITTLLCLSAILAFLFGKKIGGGK